AARRIPNHAPEEAVRCEETRDFAEASTAAGGSPGAAAAAGLAVVAAAAASSAGGPPRSSGGPPSCKRPAASSQVALDEMGVVHGSGAPVAAAGGTRRVACSIQAAPAGGHHLMQGRVLHDDSEEFLVCTTCYMYARTSKMVWKGLRGECEGAAARARKGSRAQARNDFEQGALPGPGAKQVFGALTAPTAVVKARWSEKLGVAAEAGGGASAAAPTAAASLAGAAQPARSRRTAASVVTAGASAPAGARIPPPVAAVVGVRARGRAGHEASAAAAGARAAAAL
ncbi:unnamed protein product, partial [Prorocentrum cordatum]